MNEKHVIKKIELELYFDKDFKPQERFEEPTRENDWHSGCSSCGCPFFGFEDETGYGWCDVNFGTVDAEKECPIKKFFK